MVPGSHPGDAVGAGHSEDTTALYCELFLGHLVAHWAVLFLPHSWQTGRKSWDAASGVKKHHPRGTHKHLACGAC